MLLSTIFPENPDSQDQPSAGNFELAEHDSKASEEVADREYSRPPQAIGLLAAGSKE